MHDDIERINAAALLIARGRPAQPALVWGERTLTYGELRRAVARAATAWQECGVAPGEVLMLRGDQDVEHIVAFLGAIWAGAVPVPLRTPAAPEGGDGGSGLVHYVVDRARQAAHRDGHAPPPWSAWHPDLRSAPPALPVPCLPASPACWTDPRSWTEGGARVLPHRFALALIARPGTLPIAQAPSMLAVLRSLRRGVTALLQPRPALAEPA